MIAYCDDCSYPDAAEVCCCDFGKEREDGSMLCDNHYEARAIADKMEQSK